MLLTQLYLYLLNVTGSQASTFPQSHSKSLNNKSTNYTIHPNYCIYLLNPYLLCFWKMYSLVEYYLNLIASLKWLKSKPWSWQTECFIFRLDMISLFWTGAQITAYVVNIFFLFSLQFDPTKSIYWSNMWTFLLYFVSFLVVWAN